MAAILRCAAAGRPRGRGSRTRAAPRGCDPGPVSISAAPAPVPVLAEEEALAAAHAVADALAAGAGAVARDRAGADAVPRDALAALDASGLLGITVPRLQGGAEASMATLAEVVRVIAAVDPAIAQVPQAHWLFVD